MIDDDFSTEESSFVINLDKIARHKKFTKATRLLALDLLDNPYMTVGNFFKNLSDSEIKELCDVCEREDDEAMSELLLLSEMLSRAEGITSFTPEEIGEKAGAFRVITAGVSLARKGLVKALYNNMTLELYHDRDKVIFIPKKGIDPEDFHD